MKITEVWKRHIICGIVGHNRSMGAVAENSFLSKNKPTLSARLGPE
jgi:hypothetical protein